MELLFLNLFTDEVFRYFLLACNGLALSIWLFTLVTQNFSQMDRLWSILPTLYAWAFLYTATYFNPNTNKNITHKTHINASSDLSSYRLFLITFLVTIWGLRLTYIFWRRGYYKWEHEDYRWEHVKKRYDYPNKQLAFHIFNFVFMAFMQNWILIGYVLPMWFIQTNLSAQEPINAYDIALTLVYLIFYSIEAVADGKFYFNKKKWYIYHPRKR